MLQSPGRLILLVLLLGGGGNEAVQAQGDVSGSVTGETAFCQREAVGRTLDVRGLAAVYCTTAPVVTESLEGVHASARPIFIGAIPAAWLRAGLLQSEAAVSEAYLFSLSQGITYGVVLGMKRTVGRPRPYVHRSIEARAKRYSATSTLRDYHSFPSGHASLSAAIATSWSLAHPKWYVIAPGAVWATGVSLSRLYLGVHYPSDVLAGTIFGVGLAVLVHHFRKPLTPPSLEASPDTDPAMAVPVGIQIRF